MPKPPTVADAPAQLPELFDRLAAGVLKVAADGRIVAANDCACKILGYRRDELTCLTVHELTAPEDRPQSDKLNSDLRDGKFQSFENEKRYLKRDGSPLWVHVTVSALHDEAGNFCGSLSTAQDISQRKHAEEALALTHKRMQTILDSITDGLLILDRQWRYTYFSETAARIIGVRREDMLGRVVWDLFPHARDTKFFSEYHLAMETGQPRHFEEYYPEPLNQWLECHCYPSEEGLTVYFHDVTSRRVAERSLQESEVQFRTLANAIPQLCWMANADGWIFWYNDRWYDYTGTTPEEMQGWGWQSVHHPDELPQVLERWKTSIATGEPFEMVFPIRGRDGIFRPHLTRITPVKDAQGDVVRWFGTNTDIAAQRQALDALRESEARLKLVTETTGLGTFDFYPQTGELIWSNDVKRHFGLSEDAVINYDVFLAGLHPEDRERVHATIQRVLTPESGGSYSIEYRTIGLEDGKLRWVSATGRVLFDDAGHAVRFIGATLDITERKQAEHALIRSEKLASVGRMAATVAHEINNPLELVMNSVYLASLDPTLSPEAQQHLATAEQELERVAHLTRQTLGFYRENTAPATINATSLVEGVVEMYAPKLRQRGLAVQLDLAPRLPIHVVAGEIRQVISNLIANAIDACHAGGILRVRTSSVALNGTRCVRITLADKGEGIRRENLKRIFEPFFTTKESVGTGLGLWVSSEIVRRHHGVILVHSRRGQGTVFSVFLPQSEHQI